MPPSCSTTRTGCSPRWCATRRRPTSPLRRGQLGRGARPGRRRRSGTRQDRYGRDAVGCFGGGGLTNEKAYLLGKFARVALRTSSIDYNGRFCMSSAAAAANRAFGIDRGLPFPLADIAGADVVLLVGSNPADTMPPAMQYFDAGRGRGARHIVVDPRRTATAARRAPAPAAAARHRPGAGQRPAAHRDPGGPGRRGLHRRAHHRLRRGAAARSRLLAGPGRADHRRAGGRPARDRARAGHRGHRDDPHRARRRAARQRHRHRPGLHQPGARARPARPRRAPAGARSPGRATARAGASTGRRPTSCPATAGSTTRRPARTSPRSGASTPTTCPARASPPTSCSTGSAPTAACAAAGAGGVQHRGLRAATPGTCADRLPRWTSWSSPTSSCPRPPRSPTSCCPPRSGPRRRAR